MKSGTAKTDKVLLGLGEFIAPAQMLDHARYHYLQAIRKRCPAPLVKLRDQVFPAYRDWADQTLSTNRAYAAWHATPEAEEHGVELEKSFLSKGLSATDAKLAAEAWQPRDDNPADPAFHQYLLIEDDAPGLAHVLMEWAQEFRLTDTDVFDEEVSTDAPEEEGQIRVLPVLSLHKKYWACQCAVDTMWAWHFGPKGQLMMMADPPEWACVDTPSAFTCTYTLALADTWDPLRELATDFRERIKLKVDSQLDRIVAEVERTAESNGLVRPSHKLRAHFEWLSLYQVQRSTYQRIADDSRVEPQTVKAGIKSAAEAIAMERRQGSRGPRAKRSTNLQQ